MSRGNMQHPGYVILGAVIASAFVTACAGVGFVPTMAAIIGIILAGISLLAFFFGIGKRHPALSVARGYLLIAAATFVFVFLESLKDVS